MALAQNRAEWRVIGVIKGTDSVVVSYRTFNVQRKLLVQCPLNCPYYTGLFIIISERLITDQTDPSVAKKIVRVI
jgi:hypothetical protein